MAGTGLLEQRRNLATNPSFEVNTTGWNSIGSSGVNRTTTRAWTGTSSALVTLGAGAALTNGANTVVAGFTPGQTYTVSAYLYVPAASLSTNLAIWVIGVSGAISSVVSTADAWVRATVTFVAESTSHTISIPTGATSAAGQTFYVDGLLVELSGTAGTYFDGSTPDVGSTGTLGSMIYDWTGTAHASASVQQLVVEGFTIAATVELSNVPPRVRIDVTVVSDSALNSVTVTRIGPDGNVRPVRTDDGLPLSLLASGSNRTGTLYDYEMPYGQSVTYSTLQDPSIMSNPVTVGEDEIWLIHPGVPTLSMPITLMKGSLDEEEEDVLAGVFFPLGRRNAVVITDGKRKAPSGTLIVGTDNVTDRAKLGDLLSDAFPLLLNVPPSVGIDVDTSYIHVGRVRRVRPSDVGTDPLRNWVLPFQVVDMPVGGSQSQRTWQDVLDVYPTWQSVVDAFASWADVLAPTT